MLSNICIKLGLTSPKVFLRPTFSYLYVVLFFMEKTFINTWKVKRGEDCPKRDSVYRFLNNPKFSWRQFLLSLSAGVINKVTILTSTSRVKAFIIDDSKYDRNRSKKVELLARCMDHSSNQPRYYKGFRMLTLG